MKSLLLFSLIFTLNLGTTKSFCEEPKATPIAESGQAPSSPTVAVSEPSAPPQWAQDLMVTAEKLPIVGPFIAKGLLYLGILSAILTSLTTAILMVLNTLLGLFTWAGFVNASAAIAGFRDGKVMYWLKFFSLFNAKKPVN